MSKVKFKIEIPIQASPSMLYQYISTPSNFQEWFADKVNSNNKIFSFIWNGSEEKALLLLKKHEERVRFQWLEDSQDQDVYFEFRIQTDSLTKDVSLIITDFANEDEIEESKQLWESQIESLKHTIGA